MTKNTRKQSALERRSTPQKPLAEVIDGVTVRDATGAKGSGGRIFPWKQSVPSKAASDTCSDVEEAHQNQGMSSTIDRWQRGHVDTSSEHFELLVVGRDRDGQRTRTPIALIGPPEEGSVNVRFLIEESEANAASIEKVEREINFYLLELNEPNPWRYAQYHCGTVSNVASSVYWDFVVAKSKVSQSQEKLFPNVSKRNEELTSNLPLSVPETPESEE